MMNVFFSVEDIYVKDKRIHKNEANEIMDLFLNLPPMGEMHNLNNMQNISNHQQQDVELLQPHQTNPIQALMQHNNGVNVLTIQSDPNQPTLWNIYTRYINS